MHPQVRRLRLHHYFGTRQNLYIEVLRRLFFIPPIAPSELPGESLAERAGQLLDRWLNGVARRKNIWLSFTSAGGAGSHPEVAAVLREADTVIAQRLIDALELDDGASSAHLLAIVTAWGDFAKGAIYQWLRAQTLTQDDVRRLLVATLLTALDVAADS